MAIYDCFQYFNEDHVERNKFRFKIDNLSVLFTDNTPVINSAFSKGNVFNNYNQNLILFSEKGENVLNLIKNYNIENYVILNDDNIATTKYSEIIGKTIILSYEVLITHYKYNISINYYEYEDTDESLRLFKEQYIYETSFMNRDKFLNLKNIILHSLTYDNFIVFDFTINNNRFLDNVLLKQINFDKSYFISPYFLQYKVSSLLEKMQRLRIVFLKVI